MKTNEVEVNFKVTFEMDDYLTLRDVMQVISEATETLRGAGTVEGEIVVPKETRIPL